MKKYRAIFFVMALLGTLLAGCAADDAFIASRPITVLSREDGSGTRSAFTELFEIIEKGEGTRTDRTTKEAIIASKTDVLLSSVASDRYAVGYVSLGSLGDTVKPLKVDGVYPTVEAVAEGRYQVYRPFIIAGTEDMSEEAADFISFVMSRQGQQIIRDSGYVPAAKSPKPYTGSGRAGKAVIAGSSSVAPVMEKLAESYKNANPKVVVEIQISDSTSGMAALGEGICDIAMSSRALTADESGVYTPVTIANDAIVIVVNPENPVEALTSGQVRDIFTGKTAYWNQILEAPKEAGA